MRYAIVENGIVVNVVEADSEFASQNGLVECPTAGPGWTYSDGVFTKPVVTVPEPPPPPTKEQLLAQLQALQAQIQALE